MLNPESNSQELAAIGINPQENLAEGSAPQTEASAPPKEYTTIINVPVGRGNNQIIVPVIVERGVIILNPDNSMVYAARRSPEDAPNLQDINNALSIPDSQPQQQASGRNEGIRSRRARRSQAVNNQTSILNEVAFKTPNHIAGVAIATVGFGLLGAGLLCSYALDNCPENGTQLSAIGGSAFGLYTGVIFPILYYREFQKRRLAALRDPENQQAPRIFSCPTKAQIKRAILDPKSIAVAAATIFLGIVLIAIGAPSVQQSATSKALIGMGAPLLFIGMLLSLCYCHAKRSNALTFAHQYGNREPLLPEHRPT